MALGIEAFIRIRSRVRADDSRFSRHSNLWEDGYVDSIGMAELLAFIEATYGVVLPDEVLFDPQFTSVEGIAGIVRKLSSRRTA